MNTRFQPVSTFDFDINRSERTQQARFLVPLLAQADGRVWFLERLNCPCTADEASTSTPFHYAFPLRDVFSADLDRIRESHDVEGEIEFIAQYNHLFGLGKEFGLDTVWRTQPGGLIRHPAAPGQNGWHRAFLDQHLPSDKVERILLIRQWLATEADAMLLLPRHVVLIECKFEGSLRCEQYERQKHMGELLGKRLAKAPFFGLVVNSQQNFGRVQIQDPYVTWDDIRTWLSQKELLQ